MSRSRFLTTLALLVFLAPLLFFQWKSASVPLARRLISSDDMTRNLAYRRLRDLNQERRVALVDDLCVAYRDGDARARRFALYALRKNDIPDPRIADLAVQTFGTKDVALRREGAITLMELGEAGIVRAAVALNDPAPETRDLAAEVLRRSGPAAIAPLLKALAEGDAGVRRVAADILGETGGADERVMSALASHLGDHDRNVRIAAALALERRPSSLSATVPVLIEAISGTWDDRSFHAAAALGRKGPSAKSALPALTLILRQPTDRFGESDSPRAAAARAAQRIDSRPSEILDLNWDIRNNDAAIRYRAAFALAESDPPRLGAMPVLVEGLADIDVGVAARSFHGLSRLGLDTTQRVAETAYPRLVRVFGRADGKIDGFSSWSADSIAKVGVSILPVIAAAVKNGTLPPDSADRLFTRFGADAAPFFEGCAASPNRTVRDLGAANTTRLRAPKKTS